MTAFEEGRQAHRNGKTRLDNPYARYSVSFSAWDESWIAEMWATDRRPDFHIGRLLPVAESKLQQRTVARLHCGREWQEWWKGGLLMNYLGMDDFTASYMESALWSSADGDGTPLDSAKYSDTELAEETITLFKNDCAKFQEENAELLDQADEYHSTAHQAHDFWLTRNGHGAGFWDGDYPKELGEALTIAAKAYGECTLYIGENGRIYAA